MIQIRSFLKQKHYLLAASQNGAGSTNIVQQLDSQLNWPQKTHSNKGTRALNLTVLVLLSQIDIVVGRLGGNSIHDTQRTVTFDSATSIYFVDSDIQSKVYC